MTTEPIITRGPLVRARAALEASGYWDNEPAWEEGIADLIADLLLLADSELSDASGENGETVAERALINYRAERDGEA